MKQKYAFAIWIAVLVAIAAVGYALGGSHGYGNPGTYKAPEKPPAVSAQSPRVSGPVQASGPAAWLSAPSAGVSAPVHPMPGSCKTVIDPPTSGPGFRDVYQCKWSGLILLAGHSSKYTATALNSLQEKGIKSGSPVSVTDTAGNKLSYRVVFTETPGKDKLSTDSRVWEPKPGKLVLITCDQASTASGPASKNYVVVAQEVAK